MEMPQHVTAAIMSSETIASFGRKKTLIKNERANKWLCDNLGLNTDDNNHVVNGFELDFCWKSQKWICYV